MVHPEDRDACARAFEAVADRPFDVTYRIVRPDGLIRWVRDRGLPADRDAGQAPGAAMRVVGKVEDVTDRVVDQERVRMSEERYRAAAEGGLDAFYLLDAVRDAEGEVEDFVFVDLNRRGAELISRGRNQVIGHQLCELIPANRTDGFLDRYKKVLESGETLYEEFAIDAEAEGIKPSWLAHQVIPVGDGIAISTRDITPRKQAEQDLRQQREENQAIIDGIPAMVFYKDAQNRILRVNRAVTQVMGLSADQIEGRHSREIFPDEAEAFYADDQEVIQSRRPKLGYIEKKTVGNEEHFFRADKVPVFGEDGEPRGVIAIASDVTEITRANAKLLDSESRYRSLFDRVPASVWEQDLTEIERWMRGLREQGVEDLEDYFARHPEAYGETTRLIKVNSVNRATLKMFEARDMQHLATMLTHPRYHPVSYTHLTLPTIYSV